MENYKQGIFFGLAAMYYGEFCLFTGKHWNLFLRLKFYPAGLCGPAFLCFCSLFFRKNGRFLPKK